VVFTSLRFTLAAAAFTPFFRKGFADPMVRKAGLEIGMWTALGYLAQSWALSMTPASRASLLSTFTVIAVPCLAGLSGQKVKPLVWACGLAALVGTTLLEQGGGEPPNAGECVHCVDSRTSHVAAGSVRRGSDGRGCVVAGDMSFKLFLLHRPAAVLSYSR
jgi:drug/metabolite transporter (DMT)-like permease